VVVFQNGALFPWKTNLENVAFGPIVQRTLKKAEAIDKARSMMADAGLSDLERNYPSEVSSGTRRRIEIVRALMNDPAVLLMGITWEVVVAAEMISGGGSQTGNAAGGGLGFLIWNSYVGGSYEQIVIGMISIGIAGLLSSALLRKLGERLTPWERLR
jgi:hypothetical protein